MIQDNLAHLRKTLTGYSKTTLIAVTKQQSDIAIDEVLAYGQRHFGENRVQEAYHHWQSRRALYPDLVLHLIGPLQSNKAREAVALFDMIHTIDREKIAVAISQEMKKQQRQLPCFIQVNTGNEPQKSGVSFDELSDFLQFCRREHDLNIQGLMCIPPVEDNPIDHFKLLQQAACVHNLSELSMGMSEDYEAALTCGATFIRIGSGLFGSRA